MKRRDSERFHNYANTVFGSLRIYDIQGVLRDGHVYKCGVENYQVQNFDQVDFGLLNREDELARYYFCKQLQIPYHIIISSVGENRFKIYDSSMVGNGVVFNEQRNLTTDEFVQWWMDKQSFTQTKPMYIAADRIADSLIDKVLFENKLAWGVNVDGFSFQEGSYTVNAVYEKRIATYKPPYTVLNYDPNRFFFGTANRSGDYPAWKILDELAAKLNCSLALFTFDTSGNPQVGAAKIIKVSQNEGLRYHNGIRPFDAVYDNDLVGLQSWKNSTI